MKKVIVLLVALISITSSMAQWVQQNSGTSEMLTSVYFTTPEIGFVVGDAGTLLKTVNGGNTWEKIDIGFSNYLYDIYFPNLNTGYIVGSGGLILKTTNAGLTWNSQNSGTNHSLYCVFFINPDKGFIGGGWDQVFLPFSFLVTTNGGETWTDIGFNEEIKKIQFINDSTGFLATNPPGPEGPNYLFKTLDGGNTWNQIMEQSAYSILNFFFVNEDIGYVSEFLWGTTNLYKTTNGGLSWISNEISHHGLVFFTSSDTGYLAYYDTVWKTIDGGQTFMYQALGIEKYLTEIYFPSQDTGFIIGNDGLILRTYNGGVGVNEPFSSIHPFQIFPNPTSDKIILSVTEIIRDIQFEIFTISGEKIFEQQISNNETQIDISTLQRGVYFVRLQNEEMVEVGKMVKE